MGKLLCLCGYIHELSLPSLETQWITVRDRDHEEFLNAEWERERLGRSEEGSTEWEELLRADSKALSMRTILYDCPQCGRLIWYRDEDGAARIYQLEKEIRSPSS